MKSIDEISSIDFKNIKLIVFDVDGVLVPRGTVIKQRNNKTYFETKRIAKEEIEFIRKLVKKGFLVNISSGRALFMLMDMFKEVLPYVSITYENGSATWYKGRVYQHCNSFKDIYTVDKELQNITDGSIKGREPKEFIVTIHCANRVKKIEGIVSSHFDLYCLWNGEAYDIGIKNYQTKGQGLKRVMDMFHLCKENVLAVGDNFNDKELLEESGIKISADKTRIDGDFYIPLPAEILMRKLLKEIEKK